MTRVSVLFVIGGLVLASPAFAADVSVHSGRIVAIDVATHRLTLAEMGPWSGESTRPTVRAFGFGPETTFELVTRTKGANPQGWIGGYVESALAPSAIRRGDVVTVTAERGTRGREAAAVEVVRPTSP